MLIFTEREVFKS
uniref:Uncharacterized protein n=1 Tax=Rhizophora mucronata TaxID=61149 RepID=A0A2P2N640_RHIMU